MRFRYVSYTVPKPVISLGGGNVRPKPIVPVRVIGPTGFRLRDALLDTGADDTVFPDLLARILGIDLARAPQGEAAGISGQPVVLRYARVSLRLTDGIEDRVWPAWVGFASLSFLRPVLGFAGCLQFFSAHFHGDRHEVDLTINGSYPGK